MLEKYSEDMAVLFMNFQQPWLHTEGMNKIKPTETPHELMRSHPLLKSHSQLITLWEGKILRGCDH